MKCLTVRQPYAAAILLGLHVTERRDWGTSYRGPLLIHAAAGKPSREGLLAYPQINRVTLVYNAILGMVDLIGCVAKSDDYHWLLTNPRWLATPFPCRGVKGLWVPPPGVLLPGSRTLAPPPAQAGGG
jgi:hypothetical protein